MNKHSWIIAVAVFLAVIIIFVIIEVLFVAFAGTEVPAPDIPRHVLTLGKGKPLKLAVMGDSTSIGQGAEYDESYAYKAAELLSKNHEVSFLNVGVSGARATDLNKNQVDKLDDFHPDIVIMAVGANDATHLTSLKSFRESMESVIIKLQKQNPDVKILVTGCAAMGSVPRFPWPINALAGIRTRQINSVYDELISKYNLVFAPIAKNTGQAFKDDPSLFASDKFHPNKRGYVLWSNEINQKLSTITTL